MRRTLPFLITIWHWICTILHHVEEAKKGSEGHEQKIFLKRLRNEDRPSESTVDLPCEEVLSYAPAGHLFDDDPDSLPGSCGRVQEPGRDRLSTIFTVRNRTWKKRTMRESHDYMQAIRHWRCTVTVCGNCT